MNLCMVNARARTAANSFAVAACAALAVACADKEFRPPTGPASNQMVLRISATGLQMASQQAGAFTPRFLVVAAGYYTTRVDDDSISLLAYKAFPLSNGDQNVALPVDLALCLGDDEHIGGKDACRIVVGAAIRADTGDASSDSTSNDDGDGIFEETFDLAFKGPFDISPGRPPTIPQIDLSASRIAAARFVPDEALRRGGPLTPSAFSTPPSGAVNSTGGVTVFAGTTGPAIFIFTGTQSTFFPQLAVFSNGLWSRVTATAAPSNSSFRDVTALGPTEVYMAHQTGLWRYDGTAITRVTAVTDSLISVGSVTSATGAKLLIAGGALGVTWVGTTASMTRFIVPATSPVTGVCINSPTEAFAAAGTNLFRFNGTSWSQVFSQGTANKVQLQCTGPGQAFAASVGQAIQSWDGTGFAAVSGSGLGGHLVSFAFVSPTEAYAAGDSGGTGFSTHRAFFRFNGTAWTETGRLRFGQGASASLRPWADPRGGQAFYLTSFGRLERMSSAAPSVLSYMPSLHDVWVNSATSAFVVGWNALLARWDGVRWNVDAPPAGTPVTRVMQGVWSDGPSNAWAVGGFSTIFRWNGSSWLRVSDALSPITTPDSYNAVWGSGSTVWIAGATAMVACTSGGAGGVSCGTEATGGNTPLFSVWGTSPTNIWAVGSGGRIVRRTATGWAAVTSPTTRALVRVHGSSANDVWAVGDSVLIRFDGTAWSQVPMTDDLQFLRSRAPISQAPNVFQLGLFARTDRERYLGGDFGSIAKFTGFDWQREQVPFRRRVVGISGTPAGCILALTESQSQSPVSALWRGEGGHGCFGSPMTPPTSWP